MLKKETRAQGTIEYMVIVAIVIVIALVVVGILLQLMGQGAGIGETSQQIAWKSAQPFAITDWKMDTNTTNNTGTLILILQNNSAETLTLKKVTIGSGNDWSGTININQGGKTNETEVKITNIPSIKNKNQYVIPKNKIFIEYHTQDITSTRLQEGKADITGIAN